MSQIVKSKPERYLGKYKIVSKLGQGAMGMVYKGFDPSIERYVALKTISSHLMTMDDSTLQSSLARFKQEAKIAGRLNHPNIVSVYEYGEDKNTIELKQVFQAQPVFDTAATVKLMIPLLEALKHSHDNGVIHRDIKPGNIIVRPNGNIKVTDFGIARIGSSDLTQMGTLLGTPSYMSPEILDDRDIDARTDLFSAGIIFYQCIVGRKPFEGSPQQVMNKIATREHIPPSVLNPKLSPELDRIVDKALAKNPDQRYPSAAAMIMDLRRLGSTPPQNRKKSVAKGGKAGDESLAAYRNDQFNSSSEHQDTGQSSTTPLIISIVFFIVVIIAALYVYYDRFIPGDKPPAVAELTIEPDFKKKSLKSDEKNDDGDTGEDMYKISGKIDTPDVEPDIKSEIDPGIDVKLPPVSDTEPPPLVLATLEENAEGLANTLVKSGGAISLALARSALKLKIAFVNKTESYTLVPDSIVNQIMTSDRVVRVTQGPADLICTLNQTSAGLTLNLKNRFLINDQDSSFIVPAEPGKNGEDLVRIHRLISKLYTFNTFDLLKSLRPVSGEKTYMVISGSEDNTLFVGNKTDICIHPDQEAYLILLNVNSMNITMLFPHFMNSANYIQKGESKCSGDMDVYPPTGTEMIASFLLKDKELLQKFGYTLSEQTSYYIWDYDQGQAADFCENLVVQLLNADKNWSADNEIVQIKNSNGKDFF